MFLLVFYLREIRVIFIYRFYFLLGNLVYFEFIFGFKDLEGS